MKMNYINVISTTLNGGLNQNWLFTGYLYKNVIDAAEERFSKECRKMDDKITDDELDIALDNGYFENSRGDYVCINWPTEIKCDK